MTPWVGWSKKEKSIFWLDSAFRPRPGLDESQTGQEMLIKCWWKGRQIFTVWTGRGWERKRDKERNTKSKKGESLQIKCYHSKGFSSGCVTVWTEWERCVFCEGVGVAGWSHHCSAPPQSHVNGCKTMSWCADRVHMHPDVEQYSDWQHYMPKPLHLFLKRLLRWCSTSNTKDFCKEMYGCQQETVWTMSFNCPPESQRIHYSNT